jgi:hypothetical protein
MESSEIAYITLVIAAFGIFILGLAWNASRR